METRRSDQSGLISPILIGGSLILLISFGVRSSFGVFQIPVSDHFDWYRSDFSMALAIQNLFWGIGQPIFGAIAEKIGDRKAIAMGILLYAIGIVLTAMSWTPLQMQLLGVVVGFGVAGTGFGVVLAMVGRAVSENRRSMALAIATATGSAGQVIGPPLAESMLSVMSWQTTFFALAAGVLLMLLVVPLLRAPPKQSPDSDTATFSQVLNGALRDPSYTLIFLGFFACGYQIGFMSAHFPAFVTEMCGPITPGSFLDRLGVSTTSALGASAFALIGLANIFGTLFAGWAGQKFPKKYCLTTVYGLRGVISILFILLPITPGTVVVFSLAMGALWLATIPLTSGLVGYIYGVRFMGTLYGLVFLSHQLGGFVGIWLGGRLYDVYGDYTLVWWIGIAISLFSAVVHLPIQERRMQIAA